MNNIKFPFKIFLIGILASYPFSIVFLQNLAIGIENNYLTLKKDNFTIDSLMSGGALILDYKIISENEVIVIRDIGVTNVYNHLIKNEKGWSSILTSLLGQTPQQRLKYSSAIPKDYWEIKDKIVTFKIGDELYKVDILENGKKKEVVDLKQKQKERLEYRENLRQSQDSINHKKN